MKRDRVWRSPCRCYTITHARKYRRVVRFGDAFVVRAITHKGCLAIIRAHQLSGKQ